MDWAGSVKRRIVSINARLWIRHSIGRWKCLSSHWKPIVMTVPPTSFITRSLRPVRDGWQGRPG